MIALPSQAKSAEYEEADRREWEAQQAERRAAEEKERAAKEAGAMVLEVSSTTVATKWHSLSCVRTASGSYALQLDDRPNPTLWVKEAVPPTAMPRLPTPCAPSWYHTAWTYTPSFQLHGDETIYRDGTVGSMHQGMGDMAIRGGRRYTYDVVKAFHKNLSLLEDGHLGKSADMQELLAKHPRIKLPEFTGLMVTPYSSTFDASQLDDPSFVEDFRKGDFWVHVLNSGGWAGKERGCPKERDDMTDAFNHSYPLTLHLALVLALYRKLHWEVFTEEGTPHDLVRAYPKLFRLRVASGGPDHGYLRCLSPEASRRKFAAHFPPHFEQVIALDCT